jgi:hypothetical protein
VMPECKRQSQRGPASTQKTNSKPNFNSHPPGRTRRREMYGLAR